MNRPEISIILPALNEEGTVGKVIDEVPKQALEQRGYNVKVLVVDGNSVDRTRQIARDKSAEVIIEPREGKGRAMRTAFDHVKADFIFMLDADYTYSPAYISDMLDFLEQDYSVVIGSRLKGKREKGGMSWLNVAGNYLLTSMANVLYWARISDLCTGYWGLRGEIIPDLHLMADGFNFEAELFIQIARKGYKIAEVPIHYRRRSTPSKLNSFIDGLKIGWTLITTRFHRLRK